MKTSVRVIARALRKNGYKQAFGDYVTKKGGKVVAACAIGQAALNLNVEPTSLKVALDKVKSSDGYGLGDTIIHWNDENKWTLAQIADRIERDWKGDLSQEVVV